MDTSMIIKSLEDIESRLGQSFEKVEIRQRELADRVLGLEQSPGAATSGIIDRPAALTLGNRVCSEVRKNADLLSKTDKLRLEIKAADDVIGTTSGRAIQSGGVGAPSGTLLGSHLAYPSRVIGATSAVEYSRYTGIEGGAAVQATEGADKAAVRPTFQMITQSSITIAGYSKISKQALTDSTELQRAIDVTLRRSIGEALDARLNGGAWGGANGLLAHATAYTSLVYTALVDAISEGVANMQMTGFVPDTVLLNPADWLAITVAKNVGGDYLSGSYLSLLPEAMRGLRVVLSPTVTAGKGLLVDSSQIELLIVEDLTVEIGTSGDDFTQNVRTILGEMRVIPTFRSVGAARLITPKA